MRNLFELLYYLREILVLLLAILVSITLLMTNDTRQSIVLQETYAGLVAAIPRPKLDFSDIISYHDENVILRERLMKYSLLNAEMAELARENEQLRQMLSFSDRSPYRLQGAEVISRGAGSLLSTVTINVGSRSNVRKDDPVLTMDGVLGKVLSVAKDAAVVHLVTDRNFRISVKVGSEAVRGILRPTNGGQGLVNGIPLNSAIVPGDQIVTSGFSDIFPKNLPVGIVREAFSVPGENFSRVGVDLNVRPASAEHVFVLLEDNAGS